MEEESRYWETIIHPFDLEILKKLEEVIDCKFYPQSEEIDSTWETFSQGTAPGPGFALDNNNHIIAINLTCCNIKDLKKITRLLKKLPRLIELHLTENKLEKITPLSTLSGLQKLNIGNNEIIDLTPLSSLTDLRKLIIGGTKIMNLKPLSGCTKMEFLITDRSQITDLTPLSKLTRLHTLSLIDNNINDLTPLSSLSDLKELILTSTDVTDLIPLSSLKKLQVLHIDWTTIADITPLSKLTSLRKLNLNLTCVSDLGPLANCKRLKRLYVGSTYITSLAPLWNLSELTVLVATETRVNYLDEQLLTRLSKLEHLGLYRCPIENIPKAIIGLHNCLEDVKSYFRDQNQEQKRLHEAKIILIGNGRVGKTSLVKRLLDNSFNAEEPSTHAIQLRPWLLPDLAKQVQLQSIRLNIWDFGGQDIYHATHRTFMNTEAVFLVVWDAQMETITERIETMPGNKIIKYKNYPLEYWLSYIKVLSKNSPVILVQTHRNRDKPKTHLLTEEQQKEYNVKAMLAVESSTATANGYDALKEQIQEIVVEQIHQTCTNLPATWVNVRTAIAHTQEEQHVQQLTLVMFKAMCSAEKLDTRSTQTLLRYLHNTGVFFYQKGLFNDQIVIDQKWAIDAVYTLLDRKGLFCRLHANGRFTGQDLQEHWQQYTLEEQELFVSFMQQCEICFEASNSYKWNTPLKEKEFIAPQLLPETPPLSVQALRRHEEGLYYKYRHRFLHSAIIQRFIVRTGNMAKENDMWQSGIVLSTLEGMALIEAFPTKNEIVIRLDSIDQKILLNKIRNEMREINADEAGIEELVSLDGISFVKLKDLKNNPAGNESTLAENGNWIKVDKLRIFLDLPEEDVFIKANAKINSDEKLQKPPKNKRKAISRLVMKELQQEIESKCPFCSNPKVAVFEVHHLDGDSSNADKSNLLLLCGHCHNLITHHYISADDVIKKKQELIQRWPKNYSNLPSPPNHTVS
jgi:Leucine-rich repeat (LRR) protein/GTPase SAR1 family protein